MHPVSVRLAGSRAAPNKQLQRTVMDKVPRHLPRRAAAEVPLRIQIMKLHSVLALLLLVGSASAEELKLKTVRECCSIVEARIVSLAEAEVAANSEMAKYAADKPTTDAKKFKESRDRLESFSASLKKNEEEWARLGCIHIYPK